MKFPVSILEKLLVDPVMAAKVIMGIDLDVFQKIRLRLFWGCPTVIDSSGVSTGKTLVQFLYLNLRCMLLPNHIAAIYFPTHATGIDEFWPYFTKFIESAPIYRSMLQIRRGRVGESKTGGTYVMHFKNGSRILMPAGSFMKDGSTQASRRFNTLVVDEWLETELMGDALGKQLVSRVTRESFNQNHPIWANHTKFLAHAETPAHKGYTNRYVKYRDAIRDGSFAHALITFCFKDWSLDYAKRFLNKQIIKEERMTLSLDEFRRKWLGIWTRDGDAYYPYAVLSRALRSDVLPMFKREFPLEVNIAGVDISQSTGARADWCAALVLRILEVSKNGSPSRTGGILLPTHQVGGRQFNLSFRFAHIFRNVGSPEVAGFIHLLHRVFSFSLIVLDAQGGGLSVYRELKRPEQMIMNSQAKVTPLCTPDDATIGGERQSIVRFFSRAHLGELFEPQFLTGSEGLVAAAHRDFRAGWESTQFHWPQLIENRPRAELVRYDAQQMLAQRNLDTAFKQLLRVRVLTDKNGAPMTSARGFVLFDAKGKKDAA